MPCIRLSIRSKITGHIDNQEKGTHDPEKNPSSGTDPGMAEMRRSAGNCCTKRPHNYAAGFKRKRERNEERDGKGEKEPSETWRK